MSFLRRHKGLTPEDYSTMNSANFITSQQEYEGENRTLFFDKMRKKYRDDAKALEQIDIYDPNSPYRRLSREMTEAYRVGDIKKATEIEKQVNDLYPLTSEGRGR